MGINCGLRSLKESFLKIIPSCNTSILQMLKPLSDFSHEALNKQSDKYIFFLHTKNPTGNNNCFDMISWILCSVSMKLGKKFP